MCVQMKELYLETTGKQITQTCKHALACSMTLLYLVVWLTWCSGAKAGSMEQSGGKDTRNAGGELVGRTQMWVAPCPVALSRDHRLSTPQITPHIRQNQRTHSYMHPMRYRSTLSITVHSTEQIQMAYPCSSVDPGSSLGLSGIHLTEMSDWRANLQRLDLML